MAHTTQPQPGDLGGHAARGFAWLGVQSIVEKFASGIGQIVLAWLLVPESFKLVGLTYTVTVFASLLQSAGIREVLQQRQKRLDVWTTPAFWLSTTFGLLSGIAIVLLSGWAANFYQQVGLQPLLIVASFVLPLSSMAIVPEVILRARMKFAMIAGVGSIVLLGQMVLSITFALCGLGALSIILPQPILALIRLALYWNAARPRIRHGPRPARWRYLLGDSSAMLVGSIALMITYQAGQIILGRMFPLSAAAGLFYFCTVLADQSVRVLTVNLAGVLLPALSRIQDDAPRLRTAVLNASSLLLLVGVPICLLQAALAGPIIRLFFSDKWLPAIGCFAAMSVAAIGRLVQCTSENMLHAQGRFRTYMVLAVGYSLIFVTGMILAARTSTSSDAATGVAIAGGAALLIFGPVMSITALGRLGARTLVTNLGLPVALAGLSLVPTILMLLFLPKAIWSDIVLIVAGSLSCGLIYMFMARAMMPSAWNQLFLRLQAMVPGRWRGRIPILRTESGPA